jgi:hypothetical protein
VQLGESSQGPEEKSWESFLRLVLPGYPHPAPTGHQHEGMYRGYHCHGSGRLAIDLHRKPLSETPFAGTGVMKQSKRTQDKLSLVEEIAAPCEQ